MLPSPAIAQTTNDDSSLAKLTVTAWIEGRDLFYITPADIRWHHMGSLPSSKSRANVPTGLVMATSDPDVALSINWLAPYKCPPDNSRCNNLEVDSSVLPLDVPLPSEYQLTEFEVIQGRQSLTVYQYPSAGNEYTTIIDFDDEPRPGADWYVVQLTFAAVN
ncbi:MAG TPA: hypothetical protein VMT28_12480 [Terriglobales bacterium]|nr:hypothetical protein [Terriglobales bacterium]